MLANAASEGQLQPSRRPGGVPSALHAHTSFLAPAKATGFFLLYWRRFKLQQLKRMGEVKEELKLASVRPFLVPASAAPAFAYWWCRWLFIPIRPVLHLALQNDILETEVTRRMSSILINTESVIGDQHMMGPEAGGAAGSSIISTRSLQARQLEHRE